MLLAESRFGQHRNRNGNRTEYAFNIYGGLKYRRSKNIDLYEVYAYDKMGVLLSAAPKEAVYNYTHDALGRILEKKASGRTLVSYKYDPRNRLIH